MKGVLALMTWLMDLFNPPLRKEMGTEQKVARTLIITVTVLIACTMLALVSGSVIAVVQQILRVTGDTETLARAVAIILISISGNIICFITLTEIRRIDQRSFPSDRLNHDSGNTKDVQGHIETGRE